MERRFRSQRSSMLAVAVTNAMAMGSTFLLFVAVARKSSPDTVGLFAVALAIAAAANQFIDSGLGQYAVRESARSGHPDAVLGWLVRQRARALAVLILPIWVICVLLDFSAPSAILVVVLILCNAWYGVALLSRQARRDFIGVGVIQTGNAALFTCVSILVILSPLRLNLAAAVLLPILALAPLVAVDAWLNRRLLVPARSINVVHAKDRRHFRVLLAANLVTSNLDTVVFGAVSPSLAGAYAVVQRPALGVSTLSLAVANVTLPSFASKTPPQLATYMRRVNRLVPLTPVAAVGAWVVGYYVLPSVYGASTEVHLVAFAILVWAYVLGAATAVHANVLLALGRTRSVFHGALVQAVVVGACVVIAATLNSVVAMAIGILGGRLALLVFSALAAREALRQVAPASTYRDADYG